MEVSQGAGVTGPLIEDDVLVVDEAKPAQHADPVIAEVENEQWLYKTFRVSSSLRLIPPVGRYTRVLRKFAEW